MIHPKARFRWDFLGAPAVEQGWHRQASHSAKHRKAGMQSSFSEILILPSQCHGQAVGCGFFWHHFPSELPCRMSVFGTFPCSIYCVSLVSCPAQGDPESCTMAQAESPAIQTSGAIPTGLGNASTHYAAVGTHWAATLWLCCSVPLAYPMHCSGLWNPFGGVPTKQRQRWKSSSVSAAAPCISASPNPDLQKQVQFTSWGGRRLSCIALVLFLNHTAQQDGISQECKMLHVHLMHSLTQPDCAMPHAYSTRYLMCVQPQLQHNAHLAQSTLSASLVH